MKNMFRSQELYDLVETSFQDGDPTEPDQPLWEKRNNDEKTLFFFQSSVDDDDIYTLKDLWSEQSS